MGPINTLKTSMAARWADLNYTTPLIYDFAEVERRSSAQEIVQDGLGRIVYHWGTFASPEAAAGEIREQHPHIMRNGKTVAVSAPIFTVHCFGYDPAFPNHSEAGALAAHEDHAWRLHEMFFAALQHVKTKEKWFSQLGAMTLIRDPKTLRLGVVLRCEFTLLWGIRADPLQEIQNPVPKPTGEVIPPGGTPTIIVQVP